MSQLPDVDVARISKIHGFSSAALCSELMRLAAQVPTDQVIVELGVFQARTLCHLALGALAGHGAHVWGVDPWDLPGERYPTGWLNQPGFGHRHAFTKTETREAAERNVRACGLAEHVSLVREFSATVGRMWDKGKIGLLFIDGDHRERAVVEDIEAWRRHLVPGAWVAFDDYDRRSHPDVPVVVDRYVAYGVLREPRLTAGRLMVTRYNGGAQT